MSADDTVVATRTSTWHDITRRLGLAPLVGTEEYRLHDGRILGFTYRFSEEDLARMQAVMENGAEP